MSEFLHTNSFMLVVYTNKNSKLFNAAGKNVAEVYCDARKIGFLYDDFNPNQDKKKEWLKKFSNIIIYNVAPRIRTLHMDDKIFFAKYMKDNKYMPESHLSLETIDANTPEDQLFFVKKRNSTGSRGVTIHKFKNMEHLDYTDAVIQKDITNPHLYKDRRYKIRNYIFIHKKKVYLYKDGLATVSCREYNYNKEMTEKEVHDTNVIYQRNDIEFFQFTILDDYDKIFNNMLKSCVEFEKCYREDISKMSDSDYALLGFDYIVDTDFNVFIIEINHRSNYSHPKHIEINVDVPMLEDCMKLVIDGNEQNTDYVCVV